jgi:hypothetical protein
VHFSYDFRAIILLLISEIVVLIKRKIYFFRDIQICILCEINCYYYLNTTYMNQVAEIFEPIKCICFDPNVSC